jgi:hypothetical protein
VPSFFFITIMTLAKIEMVIQTLSGAEFITENMYPSQLRLLSNEYKHDWLATTLVDEDGKFLAYP